MADPQRCPQGPGPRLPVAPVTNAFAAPGHRAPEPGTGPALEPADASAAQPALPEPDAPSETKAGSPVNSQRPGTRTWGTPGEAKDPRAEPSRLAHMVCTPPGHMAPT